jgi:hypothetical protein
MQKEWHTANKPLSRGNAGSSQGCGSGSPLVLEAGSGSGSGIALKREKLGLDLHLTLKSNFRRPRGSKTEPWRTVDAHNGSVEAQNGAPEGL